MTEAPPRANPLLRYGLLALALVATAAVLARSLSGQLVYDDLLLISRNPALGSVSELIKSFVSAHWDLADDDTALRVGYWRPLTMALLFAGRAIGGGETWGFHLVSLTVHLASVALAFVLVERLTRDTWIAGATALLFGLHPVHVESTAWISAVNDPLAGALTLAALLAYLRWRDRGSNGLPWGAGVCVLFGLLAKESALAWFALAPAIDAGRTLRSGERRFHSLLRATLPALAALAAYYLMRVGVFGELAAGFDRITSYLHSTLVRRLTLRVELLGGALQLLVWPAHLNLFREVRPEVPWNDSRLLAASAAIAVWTVATIWAWRSKRSALATALLWVPAGVAPVVLRFESIGRFPLSDRFLYLSALGVALLVAIAAVRALPRSLAALLIVGLAAAAGARSFTRTADWADEEALFRRGAEDSPRSMYVQWGLGRVLLHRFQRTSDLRDLIAAHEAFDAAQQLALEQPPDPSVLVTPFDELQSSLGMGWYYLYCALHMPQECMMDEAELVFREIAKRAPRSEEARCGLGVTLRYLGRYAEAEQAFAEATSENPKHYESWFDLGQMQIERAKWNEALQAFDRCTQIAPDSAEAWVSLAMAAIELNLLDRAQAALKHALRAAPDDPGVHTQIGVLAAREQRFDDAVESFERVLKTQGANGAAHLMRAKSLLYLGRPQAALQGFLDASRWLQEPSLDPLRPRQLFEAFYNAGVLSSELGDDARAIEALEKARQFDPDGSHREALDAALETLRKRAEARHSEAK